MASAASGDKKRLRILMLHGYTQSGPLFHAKTRALEKNLKKAFPASSYDLSLHFPTGPCQIKAPDIAGTAPDDLAGATNSEDSFGWFQRKGEAEPYWYYRFEDGLQSVAHELKTEGPFDGVMGFSQGGFLAAVVASLLEHGRKEAFDQLQAQGKGMPYPASFLATDGARPATEAMPEREDGIIHAPLKFVVSYSGFGATPNVQYTAFYEPKIATPVLNFLGSVDTVVEEARSLRLVDATTAGRHTEEGKRRLVYHPGGHFVPASQRQCLIPLLGFIQETMGWQGQDMGARAKEELDLPF